MPRLIYSLIFDLSDPADELRIVQLVAPLDRTGQSPHCRPMPPKQRTVDLRIGDELRHKDKKYVVKDVRAYREAEDASTDTNDADGYFVRG